MSRVLIEQGSLRLAGQRLAYTISGSCDAPPLILLHGFVSHRGVWRQTIEAFRDSYYCIAVDLLGFGDSDKPINGDYTLEAQGQRVLQLADAFHVNRFTLIGHSMGGQVALAIASVLAPERVSKLISVAGVVTGNFTPVVEYVSYPQITAGWLYPELYTLWRWMADHPWYAYSMFRPWFYRMDALPFQDWSVDREMAFQQGIHIPAYRAARAIRYSNLTPQLAKIKAPTLVIFGRQDATVPVADGYVIKKHVPSSRLILLDQCGHFPMYEQPQQYLNALRAFLSS